MMSDIYGQPEADDWSEDGSPFLVEQALSAMVDTPDELVWFVDPETLDVMWGNLPLRDALAQRSDLTMPRVPFARLFPDLRISARWRSLYDEAAMLGAAATPRIAFSPELEVEATLVAVHRRETVTGLAVFAKPLPDEPPPS